MRFRLETTAAPTEVFAIVADFARLDEWDPFVKRSELISGPPLQPGATYRLESIGGLTMEYRLIESEPPTRVVYRGGTRRVTSTDSISIEKLGSATQVTVETKVEFTGWTRLAAPVILSGLFLGGRVLSLPGMRRRLS